jgi:hypothetical protein
MLFDIVALLALGFAIMIVLADKWHEKEKEEKKKEH